MHAPQASELSQLLVVLAKYHLMGLLAQLVIGGHSIYQLGTLDEKSETPNDSSLKQSLIANNLRDDLGHVTVLITLATALFVHLGLRRGLGPHLIDDLYASLSHSCVSVIGAEHDGLDESCETPEHEISE